MDVFYEDVKEITEYNFCYLIRISKALRTSVNT